MKSDLTEQQKQDLHRRAVALGEAAGEMTGYPSKDKPWLKYYDNEAISAPLPEGTMFEMVYKNNKDHLNNTAINYYGRKITYGALFDAIEQASKSFYALGVRAGEIVVVCSVNTPETVYAIYALNRLGAIVNMVDPRANAEGVHKYITESNTHFVVTIELAYPLIIKAAEGTDVQRIISVSASDSLPQPLKLLYRMKNKPPKLGEKGITWNQFISMGNDIEPQYSSYNKDQYCVIAHTGGTTGEPKGVMLSNDNINAVMHGYCYIGIPFERGHRYFNDLPPFIMYGLCLATHTTLCYGLEVILYPVFDSKAFPKQFAKYRPHHFSALPDHLKYMSEDKATENLDLGYFITAAVGGDLVSQELEILCNDYLHRQNCKYSVTKGYGMTELAATACTSTPKANAIGSVGIPLIANTVKTVDTDSMQELPYNQTGEIWISGPSIMLGYYKKPKETDDMIITDENGVRWIRTGDLGHITEDGLLFHEGRIRRIYLTSYEGQPAKIFPMLVEEKIKQCDSVFDCVVVARLRKNSANYEAIAFIILKNGKIASDGIKESVEIACHQGTPSYMWPVEYRFVTGFPHTPIGKVDFRALEKEAAKTLNA